MKNKQEIRIIKQSEENPNRFEIETIPIDEKSRVRRVHVTHDYVEFEGNVALYCKDNFIKQDGVRVNVVFHNTRMQIPILDFYKVILPYLNKNQYLQAEHVLQSKCDNNGNDIAGTLNYAYNTSIIKLYDPEKEEMFYYVRLDNVSHYSVVSENFYNTYIEASL